MDRGQWPNIDIHVLPFDVGLHAGMDGAWSLLRFPAAPDDPDVNLLGDVAYVENVIGGQLNDEPPTVTRLDTLFDELRDLALGANESQDWIAQLVDDTHAK